MKTDLYPLLWVDDVDLIADWAVEALGLSESWRAPGEDGRSEHAELLWYDRPISINVKAEAYADTGKAGIALRVDDRATVDALHARAQAAGAEILMPLTESPVAYSFTALDPAGNQWWVNAETGFLDPLRETES